MVCLYCDIALRGKEAYDCLALSTRSRVDNCVFVL
jgi:hypothetical protein